MTSRHGGYFCYEPGAGCRTAHARPGTGLLLETSPDKHTNHKNYERPSAAWARELPRLARLGKCPSKQFSSHEVIAARDSGASRLHRLLT